jgi:hypothetical protein
MSTSTPTSVRAMKWPQTIDWVFGRYFTKLSAILNPEHQSGARAISRRSFVGGIVAGAAGTWALSRGLSTLGNDPAKPPQLYEYFLDNFWFEAADLEHQAINAPLKGAHTFPRLAGGPPPAARSATCKDRISSSLTQRPGRFPAYCKIAIPTGPASWELGPAIRPTRLESV